MLARQRMPEMTFDEYVAWEARQPERWEFVDGRPVRKSDRQDYDPITGMAGATRTHRAIQSNLAFALTLRLRGGPCWVSTNDAKTAARNTNARYPDLVIECGPKTGESEFADEARVVFEIVSKSNTLPDQLRLLDDHQSVASVQQVVFLEQRQPRVLSWVRHDPFWPREDLEGLDQTLIVPSLGIEIPLSEIYEGVEFEGAKPA